METSQVDFDGYRKKRHMYKLLAGNAALDFVNTLDWRFRQTGAEELLNSYAGLLDFAIQSALMSREQGDKLLRNSSARAADGALKAAIEFRESLANALYAHVNGETPPPATVSALEKMFRESQAQRRLTWRDSRAVWVWDKVENEPEWPLWNLALEAHRLLTTDAIRLVHACANDECRWLFMDTSKNHTRRWCDMKLCGNRMKARRYKQTRGSRR